MDTFSSLPPHILARHCHKLLQSYTIQIHLCLITPSHDHLKNARTCQVFSNHLLYQTRESKIFPYFNYSGHLKKSCRVSSQWTAHMGHRLLVIICRFASSPLHAKVPCSSLQEIFLTLASTLRDHIFAHTGSIDDSDWALVLRSPPPRENVEFTKVLRRLRASFIFVKGMRLILISIM
jgi:hypothetical protein